MHEVREIEISRMENRASLNWLTALMAASLHQSGVAAGINLSATDIFLVLLIGYLAIKGALRISIFPFLFFTFLSISTVLTSAFLTPFLFPVHISYSSILIALVKLLVLYFYFLAGYHLVKYSYATIFLKSFSYTGILIGLSGLVLSIFKVDVLRDLLFFGGVRFKGLMNDPNLYAVMAIASFAVFIAMMKQHFILRSFAWFLLLWCVLITGSKTGLVVYFSYLVLTIFQRNLVLSRPRLRSVFFTLFILFAAAVTPFLQNSYLTLILWVTGKIPGAERLLVLFNDFYAALGEDGSYRIHAWENAFQIIKTSPFFGIGIGTYSDVANAVAGNKVIAHNTYLQLFAEWGIPLTLLLFVFILYLVMSSFLITRGAQSWHLFNEALVIFLIASMSISLNNARLFWISLGAILYCRLQVHAEGDRLDDEDSLPIDNAVRKTHKEIP